MAQRRPTASLPSYRSVPAHERAEVTRRTITAAAVHAFRVRGYSKTTMSAVAALARVSPRTLYRYFGSKEELFAATVADATAEFLRHLSLEIQHRSLRDAILHAFEHADIEISEESREMMRIASADERVWRNFLGATIRMQRELAQTLRAASGTSFDDAPLLWDVRASALLAAISTAYRQWATTPESDLAGLVATAVDVVLPAIEDATAIFG